MYRRPVFSTIENSIPINDPSKKTDRRSFRDPIPFSKLKLYNSASDKSEYGCERIAIQTGETLNGLFFHEKLFDHVDLVVAPVLIGGRNTSTLIDGKSLFSQRELSKKVF